MQSFSVDNLTTSINTQLNKGIQVANQKNTQLQTGKKINRPSDDVGTFETNLKLKAELKRKSQRIQNLQNSLSFLQVQDGSLETAGKIIIRIAELKVKHESQTINSSSKAVFDEEFRELQIELKKIRRSKFNGVSLFSTANDKNLTEKSQNSNNLRANASGKDDFLILNRAGFLGSMKIEKKFPPTAATNSAGGNDGESRTLINLLGPSGKITWRQNPYTITDHFKVTYGNDVIHEKVYGIRDTGGNPWVELYDSPAQTNTRRINVSLPAISGERIDEIEFGRSGNTSNTLELIVNEYGQTSSGTGWDADYEIEYDAYEQDLLDDNVVWSLSDFDVQDFDNCLANLADARGENGATQNRIMGEISELKSFMLGIEGHMGRSEGLDFAHAIGKLNLVRNGLSINASLMKSAQNLENKLYTDFL